MNEVKIIDQTIKFVKKELQNAEGGHDWFHIERVYRNALLISKTENVDRFVVSLGALLHDIADAKFHEGDETVGPKRARDFLISEGVQDEIISQVIAIIKNISFKGGNKEQTFFSKELIVGALEFLYSFGVIFRFGFTLGSYNLRFLKPP